MKSGLYALAGASATASAAACANRFDEPMTNVSNVYFGFRPSTRRGSQLEFGRGRPLVLAPNLDRTGARRRATSRADVSRSERKCSSIQSRVKSFGTSERRARRREIAAAATSPNHVV